MNQPFKGACFRGHPGKGFWNEDSATPAELAFELLLLSILWPWSRCSSRHGGDGIPGRSSKSKTILRHSAQKMGVKGNSLCISQHSSIYFFIYDLSDATHLAIFRPLVCADMSRLPQARHHLRGTCAAHSEAVAACSVCCWGACMLACRRVLAGRGKCLLFALRACARTVCANHCAYLSHPRRPLYHSRNRT